MKSPQQIEHEFKEICFIEVDSFIGGKIIEVNAEHLGDVKSKLLPKILAFIHKIREEDRKAFIEMIPEEKEIDLCENPCDSCLKNEGFNACRQELLDKLNNVWMT